jgi:hypothetical protein
MALAGFTDPPHDRETPIVSFKDLMYRKDLLKELQATTWPKKPPADQRLRELLLYFNYNHTAFIRYCREHLTVSLSQLKTLAGKKQWLLLYRKELQQLPVLPEAALKGGFPSVVNEINAWVEAELAYVVRYENEYSSVPPERKELQTSFVDYVELALTEAGILAIIKATVDAGLTLNQTYRALVQRIGPQLATKHKKGFSPDSVLKKGDRITPQVKSQVNEFLRIMMRLVNDY